MADKATLDRFEKAMLLFLIGAVIAGFAIGFLHVFNITFFGIEL